MTRRLPCVALLAALSTAFAACAAPSTLRADTTLTTTAERSGFARTGRYDEVVTLCERFEDYVLRDSRRSYVVLRFAPHVAPTRLVQEIRNTRPLSVVMAEQVAALRAWAKERTVPAE